MKISTNIDLQGNQILNVRIQQLGAAPSSPVEGQIYFNTSTHGLYYWNGSTWVSAAGISLPIAESDVTNLTTDLGLPAPKASPTFTGTVTIPTASAGDSSTKAASTSYVRGEIDALINSAPGTLNTLGEIATALAADENAVGALTTLVNTKAPVNNAVFTGTTTLAADPGSALQAATKQYVDSAVAGATGSITKQAFDIGDNSTSTFTLTHNMGTRNVHVSIYEKASPYAQVYADVAATTANTVSVTFNPVPTTNQFTAVVLG